MGNYGPEWTEWDRKFKGVNERFMSVLEVPFKDSDGLQIRIT